MRYTDDLYPPSRLRRMEPDQGSTPHKVEAGRQETLCAGFRILHLRGQRVILDFELARLYGISTRALLQAVRRNRERFPGDFLFVLEETEVRQLPAGEESLAGRRGGNRRSTLAFTEQGVAMLSSVLRSRTAVQVNIEVMRAFVRLRHVAAGHMELADRVDTLEKRFDGQFRLVFDALRELIPKKRPSGERIGFQPGGPSSPESNGAPRGAP